MTEQQQPTTTQAPPLQQVDSPPSDTEKRYTQAEFDARLDTTMKEKLERQRRTFEAQQREKEAQLEQQRLEDQKEFEQLARQRADEIRNLKPRADLAEGYEKRVQRVMDIATQSIAPEIQTILGKLSLPDQLDWLEQHLEGIGKAPPTTSARTDINAWSRTSPAPTQLTDAEYREKKRAESIYK